MHVLKKKVQYKLSVGYCKSCADIKEDTGKISTSLLVKGVIIDVITCRSCLKSIKYKIY